jgi:Translin family
MSSTSQSFDLFRVDLDNYNDRRERLIKVWLSPSTKIFNIPFLSQASRDVTNLSKKIIFLLHRIVAEDSSDDRTLALRAASRAKEKLREVQVMYAALKDELQGDRFWRYQRQVSPGLQEYIEALSFAHYLEHETLIKFDQVQDTLRDADGVPVRMRNYCHVDCVHIMQFVLWFR